MTTVLAEPSRSPTKYAPPIRGLAYGFSAYLWWGFVPLYFKLLSHVPPLVVLAHRVVWSVLFMTIAMTATRQWRVAGTIVRQPRTMLILAIATLMLSVNWYTFIYAIEHNVAVQASMGYFVNPLVNVMLGMLFLHERLRKMQLIGLALAGIGVAAMTVSRGQLPAIALILAISFGFYGLLRKLTSVGPVVGLTIETTLLLIPAMVIAGHAAQQHHFDGTTYGWLAAAGVVTAVPLLLFAAAARHLRLATLGFLQYIGPTCQFIIAVFIFKETLRPWDVASFGFIWVALAVYSWDSYRAFRRASLDVASSPAEA